MGLETPLWLLGLLAAAIPLLAHRMRHRELQKVVLPTFALLSRAAARSQRKRSFTDMLLLALRIAILAGASLAMAAPYVTARIAFGDGKVTAVAIVIDDSLSMSRHAGRGTVLTQAIERAATVVAALPPGSDVAVVLAGKPARVLVPLTKDLGVARHELGALPDRSTRAGDLTSAVGLAARALASATQSSKRMLVLSDFARHVELDPANLDIENVEVTSERVGGQPSAGNLRIASVHTSPDPGQAGTTSVSVELSAQGKVAEQVRVEVVQGAAVLASQEVSLAAGHATAVLHVPTPGELGNPGALVRVAVDDALDADNQAGVILTRADALRVLFVNGDPHPGSADDELYYVQRALSLLPESMLTLSVHTIDPLLLARTELRDADVVVLANVTAPSEAVAQRLSHFVEHGGGLIITAGANVVPARYNGLLGNLLATRITSLGSAADMRFAPTGESRFLPEGLVGLREARTQKRLLLDSSAQTLLRFEDGSPALCARDIGEGRSLLFATSIDADFTDLPFRPGFLPLIAAMLRDVAVGGTVSKSSFYPGEVVELPLPRQSAAMEVIDPTGRRQRLRADAEQRIARFAATDTIGAYQVRLLDSATGASARSRGAFVVAAPRQESDLSAGPVPASPHHRDRGAGSAVHRPISSLIYLLVGLLVFAEGVVRLRRRS